MRRRSLNAKDRSGVTGDVTESDSSKSEILTLLESQPPFSTAGNCVPRKQVTERRAALDVTMDVRQDDAGGRPV